jgi:hypothetical protein
MAGREEIRRGSTKVRKKAQGAKPESASSYMCLSIDYIID